MKCSRVMIQNVLYFWNTPGQQEKLAQNKKELHAFSINKNRATFETFRKVISSNITLFSEECARKPNFGLAPIRKQHLKDFYLKNSMHISNDIPF